MAIRWREELKETEQTRALNGVYNLDASCISFCFIGCYTSLVFLLLRFYTVFNTIVNLNVCSLAIFRFVIKMHFFLCENNVYLCIYINYIYINISLLYLC